MKPLQDTSTQEVLANLVEQNAENGFCVLRAKVRGHREVVTAVVELRKLGSAAWRSRCNRADLVTHG
jgi:exodeoxyribonuclease V alpha subunit